MKVNMINATTNVIQCVKTILKSIKVLFNKILNLHQWLVWCGITWIIWNLYTFQIQTKISQTKIVWFKEGLKSQKLSPYWFQGDLAL